MTTVFCVDRLSLCDIFGYNLSSLFAHGGVRGVKYSLQRESTHPEQNLQDLQPKKGSKKTSRDLVEFCGMFVVKDCTHTHRHPPRSHIVCIYIVDYPPQFFFTALSRSHATSSLGSQCQRGGIIAEQARGRRTHTQTHVRTTTQQCIPSTESCGAGRRKRAGSVYCLLKKNPKPGISRVAGFMK